MVKITHSYLIPIIFVLACLQLRAQTPSFPHGFAPWELSDDLKYTGAKLFTSYTTPPVSPVRASAEWEEIDALMVTWTDFISTVREIVKYARLECDVFIICEDSNDVKDDLLSHDIPTDNVFYIETDFNTIWCRDYGQWNIYTNNVDSLYLGDWLYNRPRPDDDAVPLAISDFTGIPIYQTTEEPYELVSTGGNFMCDGWGTGFSSKLILDAYQGGGMTITPQNEDTVDMIMNQFMGIHTYIKMETLPYDEIHHIDMHLKLLDEETLLVGEYPEGVADGPQIEENLAYIQNNFNSVYGTPYKVVRMPMPPDGGNDYPDNGGAYRTYTNCVFVNKTVLVPFYEEEFDTTAIRILQNNLPGYKIQGINCNSIINQLGAIHCITKEVATNDPLLITHQPLQNTDNTIDDYAVNAWILHRDGIASAQVYYTTDTSAGWNYSEMILTDELTNTWTGYIPAQIGGTRVYYYIDATAENGKKQVRPITAPQGFWRFDVGDVVAINEFMDQTFKIYPNPFSEQIYFEFTQLPQQDVEIIISNMAGEVLTRKSIHPGTNQTILSLGGYAAGTYILQINGSSGSASYKIIKL